MGFSTISQASWEAMAGVGRGQNQASEEELGNTAMELSSDTFHIFTHLILPIAGEEGVGTSDPTVYVREQDLSRLTSRPKSAGSEEQARTRHIWIRGFGSMPAPETLISVWVSRAWQVLCLGSPEAASRAQRAGASRRLAQTVGRAHVLAAAGLRALLPVGWGLEAVAGRRGRLLVPVPALALHQPSRFSVRGVLPAVTTQHSLRRDTHALFCIPFQSQSCSREGGSQKYRARAGVRCRHAGPPGVWVLLS